MKRYEGQRPRQTRIVATIGLCHDKDYPTFLQKLCEAGVDVLRLNMSHSDKDYAKEREILAWGNRPIANHETPSVAVMADLQGPKTRIGRLPDEGIELTAGRVVLLVPEGVTIEEETQPDGTHPPVIPVPEPLGDAIQRGLRELAVQQPNLRPSVLFGDGDIIVEVTGLTEHYARAIVVAGGVLGSRKGITIREIDLDLDPFPEKDQRDLTFCLEQGVDFVALSFVRTVSDLERVRAFIRSHRERDQSRPEPRLVAKIETLSALQHIDAILDACDGVMVARGDLGLQLGVEEVPMVQKQLIAAARRHGKPCIVATQMLESMITNPVPTRAEATDVFNAIVDGGDAVMLSGETSVGLRPYQCVATMDRLARKAEAWCHDQELVRGDERGPREPDESADHATAYLQRINEAFAFTAVQFAEHLPARAIVCFTRTGQTPERLSRQRPTVPLLAFCGSEAVARRLLLYFGLHPVLMQGFDADRQKLAIMIESARDLLRKLYGMTKGEAMVVTAGIDWPKGGTNSLQVVIEDHKVASETAALTGTLPGWGHWEQH
jgi:pyruvate kinase